MRFEKTAFATLVVTAAVAIATAGCGSTEVVCKRPVERYTVLPFTSPSDIALSKDLAPDVVAQAAERAAQSCGTVAGGIVDGHPEQNLVIRSQPMEPDEETAQNRTPYVRDMRKTADEFFETHVLSPLEGATKTPDSPFLGALSKVAQETVAHDRKRGTIVLIGDSVARERSPSGAEIDFRDPVPQARLDEFLPLLKGLKGHCVMLIGQGGVAADIDPRTVRRSREMLATTLAKAGVGFTATRSPDLPDGCQAATAPD